MKNLATNGFAALGLAAYVWASFGVGPRVVYCVGSDGHSGIELEHESAHKSGEPLDSHSGFADRSGSCVDTPLSPQISKEHEKFRSLSLQAAVSLPLRFDGGSGPVSERARPALPAFERTISLQTTVLRI